jgi:hypothetical protein
VYHIKEKLGCVIVRYKSPLNVKYKKPAEKKGSEYLYGGLCIIVCKDYASVSERIMNERSIHHVGCALERQIRTHVPQICQDKKLSKQYQY